MNPHTLEKGLVWNLLKPKRLQEILTDRKRCVVLFDTVKSWLRPSDTERAYKSKHNTALSYFPIDI